MLVSDDDIEYFIGAEYLGCSVVNTALETANYPFGVEVEDDGWWGECNTMFVNINTDRGVVQFAAYNIHSGYYGHSVRLVINDKVESEEVL